MRLKAFGELHRNGASSASPIRMLPDDTAARKIIDDILRREGWRCPQFGTDNRMPSGARL